MLASDVPSRLVSHIVDRPISDRSLAYRTCFEHAVRRSDDASRLPVLTVEVSSPLFLC